MKTYPQGSLLTPIAPLAMGRIKANPGQTFWVTSPQNIQTRDGMVAIARSGKGSGYAVNITLQHAETYFQQITSND